MAKQNLKNVLTELDTIVLNIELTLISITQGVALFFLIDNARSLLMNGQYFLWPYVLMGLLIIFIFWSRSMMHTLTLIRWPLEFGHNFLYIASTLVEAVAFTQLAEPRHWFLLNAIYGVVIWLLFFFDLRLIRRLRADGEGPAEKELCRMVEKDQWANICFLVPSGIAFSVCVAGLAYRRPEIFEFGTRSLIFIFFQVLAAVVYLAYSLRFFMKVAPLAERTRQEWQDEAN